MTQRKFLELTHNPFAPPREGFFGGGDRQTHLDHIRHLSQWSRRILLVTGVFGVGKSTLFAELSNNLDAKSKASRLSGSLVTSEREVVSAIARGFGVAVPVDLHIVDVLAIVREHVEEEHERGRICMVMVDDGHQLSSEALRMLLQLVVDTSLRLVLFAETSVISTVSSIGKTLEIEWFEIRLTGFSRVDVRNYLEWRFAQAQYRGRLPFTDAQVERIAERSGGVPNLIDLMANELLGDLEAGVSHHRASGFPRQHVSIALLLALALLLTYLVVREEADVSDDRIAVGEKIPPGEAQDAGHAGERVAGAEDEEAPVGVSAGAERAATAAAGTPEDSAAAPTALILMENARFEAPEVEELLGDAAHAPIDEQHAVTPAEQPGGDTVVGEAPTLHDAAAAQPEPVTAAETPAPAAETSPRIPVVTSRPVEATEPPARPLGIKGGAWLRRQNPQAYTVQLLSLSRQAGGIALIERQSDREEFAMLPIERDGQRLYVITYGVFSSEQAARQATANFTGEIAKIKPWVRRISGLQNALAD